MLAADPILAPAEVDTARDELGELARAFAGLQQRLAQQEDARRMFVATASHELRTPLTSLQNLLELTVDETDPDRIKQDVEQALLQAQRLSGLSKGLLDLSRLDAGAPAAQRAGRAGRALASGRGRVRATRAGSSREQPLLGARATPRASPGSCACWSTTRVRYAPAGAGRGARRSRSTATSRSACSTAAPASPTTERDAIFERFQRGEHTTAPGFGLGLAIGAELARRMRGELKLEPGDPPPGEPAGARFVLILPHA